VFEVRQVAEKKGVQRKRNAQRHTVGPFVCDDLDVSVKSSPRLAQFFGGNFPPKHDIYWSRDAKPRSPERKQERFTIRRRLRWSWAAENLAKVEDARSKFDKKTRTAAA
jgi:hypothetical protein